MACYAVAWRCEESPELSWNDSDYTLMNIQLELQLKNRKLVQLVEDGHVNMDSTGIGNLASP